MSLSEMSHEMSFQLELFATVADVASAMVKGNSSLDKMKQVQD